MKFSKIMNVAVGLAVVVIVAFCSYAFIPGVRDWVNSTAGLQGEHGRDGKDGQDGQDGAPGESGLTPHIGENGNWFIGDEDTGISAGENMGDDSLIVYQHNISISAGTGSGYNTRIYLTIFNNSDEAITTLTGLMNCLPEGLNSTKAYPCGGFQTTNSVGGIYIYDVGSQQIRLITGPTSEVNMPLQQLLINDIVLKIS